MHQAAQSHTDLPPSAEGGVACTCSHLSARSGTGLGSSWPPSNFPEGAPLPCTGLAPCTLHTRHLAGRLLGVFCWSGRRNPRVPFPWIGLLFVPSAHREKILFPWSNVILLVIPLLLSLRLSCSLKTETVTHT